MEVKREEHERPTMRGYSSSHLDKGIDYHNRFSSLLGRRLMWEQEQSLMERLVQVISERNNYLDFATGTGRVLSQVAPYFDSSYGLDISAKMLQVAKKNYPSANLIQADFREDPDALKGLKFDLITAFRFFPNAGDELRDDAMRYISQHLHSGGYLISNNHQTFESISYYALRLFQRIPYELGMPYSELLSLGDKYSLNIVSTYSFGVLPQTESRAILPWKLMWLLEKLNYRFGATKHKLGYNTVYIFKKE